MLGDRSVLCVALFICKKYIYKALSPRNKQQQTGSLLRNPHVCHSRELCAQEALLPLRITFPIPSLALCRQYAQPAADNLAPAFATRVTPPSTWRSLDVLGGLLPHSSQLVLLHKGSWLLHLLMILTHPLALMRSKTHLMAAISTFQQHPVLYKRAPSYAAICLAGWEG